MPLRIESLDAGGDGVARGPDGKVCFVEGALPGELVEATLLRRRPRYDRWRAVAILEPSAARESPRCSHFGTCGGCALQHVAPRTQLAAKQRWLEECLARIGKAVPETMLAPIEGEAWHYRCRARLSVRWVPKKGGALVGFRERRSSYVTDMRECPVLPRAISLLLPALRGLVGSLEARSRIPQIELASAEAAPALVFRHLDPLSGPDLARLRDFARAHGVHVWLQPQGPESAHPFEPADSVLEYTLPDFGVRIGFRPTDFTQVNHAMNRVLVARTVALAAPAAGDRIADLYCGLGNFALPLARQGARVTGFEGNEMLIARARANAARHGLAVDFRALDLGRPGFARYGPFDTLVLDPPREGAIETVKELPAAWPGRIVYVSCDPATLARDAGVLVHVKGFRLAAAGVVNMFPHTAHVESVCLFERR